MELNPISVQRELIIKHIKRLLDNSEPHSSAFVARILGPEYENCLPYQTLIDPPSGDLVYQGYPQVARMGYLLNISESLASAHIDNFLAGLTRLKGRTQSGLKEFASDDLAVLGIATGLVAIKNFKPNKSQDAQTWLLEIIDNSPKTNLWSYRMRDLAGDLLDCKGRLHAKVTNDDCNTQMLESVLQVSWPDAYKQLQPTFDNSDLLRNLLFDSPKGDVEIEKACVWLRFLDIEMARRLAIKTSDFGYEAVALLERIKAQLDKKAAHIARRRLVGFFALLFLLCTALVILIYYLTWDVMEPWTYLIGVVYFLFGYGYYVIKLKEFNPLNFKQSVSNQKERLYKEFEFDLEVFEKVSAARENI